MPINSAFLEELKSRIDIVELIESYISLKRSGSGFVALCPFHNEKTPSFSVSRQRQTFHCFGCGEGGDCFGFIMKKESLDFIDAVQFLADRYGMRMPDDASSAYPKEDRKRLVAANTDAARFFYETLISDSGKEAREYFLKRGLTPATIKRFGLGFAKNDWRALTDHLKSKGYKETELLSAGLVSQGAMSNIYDRFRNRMMFPIINIRGEIIGFGGRSFGDEQPKYLNSPDSYIFNKSRNLFAMNIAKATASDEIILAEGYMDVISLHQAGFNNTVASLGTALTAEQAKLISNYSQKVIISYDSDDAGKNAAQRAIPILIKAGLSVRIITIPDAKDPDEYIKRFGAESFKKLLNKSENHIEFRLETLKKGYNTGDRADAARYLSEAAKLLSTLDSEIERDMQISRLSAEYGISKEAFAAETEKYVRSARRNRSRQQEKIENEILTRGYKDSSLRIKPDSLKSARAEKTLLFILMDNPEMASKASELTGSMFAVELYGSFFDFIRQRGLAFSFSQLYESFTAEQISKAAEILSMEQKTSDSSKALADCIDIIVSESRKKSITSKDDFIAYTESLRKKKSAKTEED